MPPVNQYKTWWELLIFYYDNILSNINIVSWPILAKTRTTIHEQHNNYETTNYQNK